MPSDEGGGALSEHTPGSIVVANFDNFDTIFSLLDRNVCGQAGEAEVLAALSCGVRSEGLARKMIARLSENGVVDASTFRQLLEECIPASLSADPEARHKRLVKLLLAVAKQFERDANDRLEFSVAVKARECAVVIRDTEGRRAFDDLRSKQDDERTEMQEAQMVDAIEFNRQWTANMEEFEKRADEVVSALRTRHEDALALYVDELRPALRLKFSRYSKETLEAKRVQERLVRSGEYNQARKHARLVARFTRRDEGATGHLVDAELTKRVEVGR